MNRTEHGMIDFVSSPSRLSNELTPCTNGKPGSHARDPEALRQIAWDISALHLADQHTGSENHVGLAAVSPLEGFLHWRLQQGWVEGIARSRGDAWHHCRMVARVYDVSYIDFNGLNAHSLFDISLPTLAGHSFFKLLRPGTFQLAEIGFVLRNGEFIPAARSNVVSFPGDSASRNGGHGGLLVDARGRVEPMDNIWEQDRILADRRRPHLKNRLRLAAFSFASLASGHDGPQSRFVTELAAGQSAQGHEVHVFVPSTASLNEDRKIDGVHYHPLPLAADAGPVQQAQAFGNAAHELLRALGSFDLVHLHEWMAAQGPHAQAGPAIVSFNSIESIRRHGSPVAPQASEIEVAERSAAQHADRVLTPPWLRDRVVAEFGLDGQRVVAFPMEGRMPDEWESPLDFGHVKMGIGVGPLDRLLLFVGPLDGDAGVDVLVESLPTLLHRWGNLRIAFVGEGHLHGHLHHRAHQIGAGHALRLLGHVEGSQLTRLLRSAEALILPSRCRVPFDDAVIDLARRAGRPVVTTHGGPSHLVRHEENGLLTYDNPGSMVWAVDRILGDPDNTQRMGRNGKRGESSNGTIVWTDVARQYLELCAAWFPQLSETRL